MSLEQVLNTLVEVIQAQTVAMNKYTETAEKLLASRSGAPVSLTGKGSDTAVDAVKNAIKGAADKIGDAAEKIAETEKPAKKTAAKKTAAKKAPAKKEPEPEPEPEPETDDDDADIEPKTMLDVRNAAVALRDEVGKEALETAKKAFKISGVKELAEENFAMFIRFCEDKIAEEGV